MPPARECAPSAQILHVHRDPRDIVVCAAFYFYPWDEDKFDKAIGLLTQIGKVTGGYRQHLSAAQIERLEASLGEAMRGLGYTTGT